MVREYGPINLIVRKNMRNESAIKNILAQAESRVGKPGTTLVLVDYHNGDVRAKIAMREYTEPGERMEFVEALKQTAGVTSAG